MPPHPPHKLSPPAERRLRRAATVFVVFVALAAAVLSFSGLHELALAARFPRPIAWLFPIATDVAVAAFSLAVVHHTLSGMRVWYPWMCMLLGVGVSVAGNVWAAPDDPVSRLVHAWPPVVFALSFEALARLLRHRIERGELDGSDDARSKEPTPATVQETKGSKPHGKTPTPVDSAPTPSGEPRKADPGRRTSPTSPNGEQPTAQVGAAVKTAQVSARDGRTVKDRVIAVLQEHNGLTHAQIAQLVGADRSNVSKVIRGLRTTHPELFNEGEG